MTSNITPLMRCALIAKAALLLAMAALFAALAFDAVTAPHHLLLRVVAVLVCTPISAFLGWNALKGLADGLTGAARTIAGAEALPSNRSGLSFRLPDGHFAEFVLFNPWEKPVAGRRYTLVVGRCSAVVVARPLAE